VPIGPEMQHSLRRFYFNPGGAEPIARAAEALVTAGPREAATGAEIALHGMQKGSRPHFRRFGFFHDHDGENL
jgi:hypothetical protein